MTGMWHKRGLSPEVLMQWGLSPEGKGVWRRGAEFGRMFSMKTKKGLVLAAGIAATAALSAAPIPPEAVSALQGNLPVLVSPMPASGAVKINPVASESRLSPDRSLTVTLGDEPFSMTAVAEGGGAVELSVPVKPGSAELVKRWFMAEDVFGKAKWNVGEYEAKVQNLLYFAKGNGPVNLAGRIPLGSKCLSLGSCSAGKTEYRMLLAEIWRPGPVDRQMSKRHCVALAREAPPATTMGEYDRRIKELNAEYAYRDGREWGSGHFPLMSWHPKHRMYACAAFANDFACYVFGKMYWQGEAFSDPNEIRAGDYVRMDGNGHKFIVVYRKGSVLHTIEGNLNKVVSRSKSRYVIKNGKLLKNGQERKITQAFHFLAPQNK